MQHREIFTTKYLREIGKYFDLLRDVPNLAAVRQHVADWQISYHNGTIIKQSEIQFSGRVDQAEDQPALVQKSE